MMNKVTVSRLTLIDLIYKELQNAAESCLEEIANITLPEVIVEATKDGWEIRDISTHESIDRLEVFQ